MCLENCGEQDWQHPLNNKSYQSYSDNLELAYSNLVNNILEQRHLGELPSHVNLTGYGGGSAMAVITQLVVVQLVILWYER